MSQYEPYYPFVAEMVNKGIFDKAEIENKNILIQRFVLKQQFLLVKLLAKIYYAICVTSLVSQQLCLSKKRT